MTAGAVIGCGTISIVHLGAITSLDGIDLVGVCDTDADRAAAVGREHGVPWFTDHAELLETARPEVVHICTPHDEHVPVAIDSIDAGVAVLLEKPVAQTVAEAERLIAATRRRPDVQVGVCFQNRYNTTVQAARALLGTGDLGRVLGASATLLWHRDPAYYEARPWRGRGRESGGGGLINQAIHTLGLLQWLLRGGVGVGGDTRPVAPGGGGGGEGTGAGVVGHA